MSETPSEIGKRVYDNPEQYPAVLKEWEYCYLKQVLILYFVEKNGWQNL